MLLVLRNWAVPELPALLVAMTRIARRELRIAAAQFAAGQRSAPFPRLYASGVVYRREPPGLEEWQSPFVTLERGWGDCEDLALWRAAELQESGEDPRAVVAIKRTGPSTWHALVCRGNGQFEDPSRKLGMGSPS